MAKVLKAKYNTDNNLMECHYCGKVTGVAEKSKFTKKGYLRIRHKNLINCSDCSRKFYLR